MFSLDIELINHHRGYVTQSPALYSDSGWRIAQANDIYSFVGVKIYQLIAEAYVHLTYSNAYITAREFYRMSQDPTSNPYTHFLLIHDQKLADYSQEDVGRISLAMETIKEAKTTIK